MSSLDIIFVIILIGILFLSRYPQEYEHLIQEYKDEKNQQFIDKIDQVSMLINMVEMMM